MPREGMNKVILVGAVASEPRYKVTSKGTPRLWFRVCIEEPYTDEQGELKERRSYHSVVAWAKNAVALERLLREGHTVAIEGRLTTRNYEHGGTQRYDTEVVAHKLVVLGSPLESAALEPPGRTAA